MKKWVFAAGVSGLLVFLVITVKEKRYAPQQRLERAMAETTKMDERQELMEGDLIFQASLSGQSDAIQIATRSEYSHCGIIYKEKERFYVFEAVQPVKTTPLEQWIARGENGRYVIKRLKNARQVLTPETLQKMKQEGAKLMGKNYDLSFAWSDENIYCSELIWKVYQRAAGIEIGKLQKLRDFDLSHEIVKKIMRERYGDQLPMDETVISPAAIFDSELLETVQSN
jgi:hypothetical protein